jgi:hypothetical protein
MAPHRYAFAASLVFLACGGKIDLDATEKTATRRVGTVAGTSGGSSSGATSSSSSSSSSSSGAIGSCDGSGLIPFDADFESGAFDDDFTVNSPSAFSIDWEQPISGSASLRVEPNLASYIARKTKSVCAARLQFTLRATADFLSTGSHIARINAGSRRFSIFAGSGNVFLLEEIESMQGGGIGSGPSYGAVIPGDPTTFMLDVDLNAKKVTFGVKSRNLAGETHVLDMAGFPLASPPAITSIEIGTTPGGVSRPEGLYWVDDISID